MDDDLPAILGGRPVNPAGPPAWPMPDPDVQAALQAAYANGSWGVYLGPNVPRLEDDLKVAFGMPQVLTCASGTLAVEAALRGVGVSPGDEVAMGAYDYEPNFLSVLTIGAKPVLVDCQADSPVVDADLVAQAITPKTKAILATHLHGALAPMAQLRKLADTSDIPLVEDAVQAIGGVVNRGPVGSWGDASAISFGGSKLLTAGRGGAVMFKDKAHAQRAKLFLSRGVQQWGVLSELQAAVLMPQLESLPMRTQIRDYAARDLQWLIRDIPGLRPLVFNPLPPSITTEMIESGEYQMPPLDQERAYYKLGMYLDETVFGCPRERFVATMRAEGIAFDVGYRPVHLGRSPSRYSTAGELPNAEHAGRQLVMLHHPILLQRLAGVRLVAEAVRKTHRHAGRLA